MKISAKILCLFLLLGVPCLLVSCVKAGAPAAEERARETEHELSDSEEIARIMKQAEEKRKELIEFFASSASEPDSVRPISAKGSLRDASSGLQDQ